LKNNRSKPAVFLFSLVPHPSGPRKEML